MRFAASTVVEGGGRIIVAGHDAVLSVTQETAAITVEPSATAVK
jgi:hypothetical protein